MDKAVMNEAVFLVTPEEAAALSKYTGIDVFTFVRRIKKIVKKEFAAKGYEIDEYFPACVLMTAFTAGRVQGIREERAKRR